MEGIEVPNGFSPNGDGPNDLWYIPVADQVPVTIEVYNRWGQKVYFAKQYQNDWDGTRNGKPLPAGTYYYVLKVNDGINDRSVNGTITIVR